MSCKKQQTGKQNSAGGIFGFMPFSKGIYFISKSNRRSVSLNDARQIHIPRQETLHHREIRFFLLLWT